MLHTVQSYDPGYVHANKSLTCTNTLSVQFVQHTEVIKRCCCYSMLFLLSLYQSALQQSV